MSTKEKGSKQIELLELENTISNKISQTNMDNILKLLGYICYNYIFHLHVQSSYVDSKLLC